MIPPSAGQQELFSVADDTSAMPVCWSYGMGVESTAGVHRTIVDPAWRPPELLPDLSNLIVMIAQTGDEWTDTIRLVEHHMLPVLRRHRVRLVEVARAGPSEANGIVILQDTRTPVHLHANPDRYGFFLVEPGESPKWGHAPVGRPPTLFSEGQRLSIGYVETACAGSSTIYPCGWLQS